MRGTQTPREWLANFTAVPNTFTEAPEFGLVHLGFERMSRSVRLSIQQLLGGVPVDARITVLGHSLGGAMATLTAVDLQRNFGRTRIDVCTVGAPRVGKFVFRRKFNEAIPGCFRITNQFDIVPHVPSLVTGWNHAGEEIEVDGDVDSPHSLNAYLHGLRNIGSVREIVMDPSLGAPAVAASGPYRAVSVRVP
jgi:predicted lipase